MASAREASGGIGMTIATYIGEGVMRSFNHAVCGR